MNIIEVSHLVKEYKKIKKESGLRGAVKNLFVQKAEYVRAVDDISFNIEKGDIVGYIGPNGAGKSTTVKMLSGIMQPTIGLDVEAKYSVRKFIKEINQQSGTTIILTTHDLGDIQELCQRVIIINEGKIIEDGSLDELVDKIAPYRHLIVDFYHPATIPHPHAELVSVNEARAVYRFCKDEITAAQLIGDISRTAPIKEVGLEEAKIDDIIRTVYRQGNSAG